MAIPSIWEMLGGNTLSNAPSATADLQTGVMSVTPGKVKHPFLSKFTGKDKEVDKMNQMMALLAAQRNSELGGENAAGNREIQSAKTKAMIAQMMGLNMPINKNTEAGYASEQYPKGMFSAAQQGTQSKIGSEIAANRAATSQAELLGQQAQARIDAFNPQDVINQDKALDAKARSVMVPPANIMGALNASGYLDPLAYGSTESQTQPMFTDPATGNQFPMGAPTRTTTPGRFVKGNIMSDLQSGMQFPNGPSLQVNPQTVMPVQPVAPADTTAPQTKVNPKALGIDPTNKKTNYSYQLGYLLKSLGATPGPSWPFAEQP